MNWSNFWTVWAFMSGMASLMLLIGLAPAVDNKKTKPALIALGAAMLLTAIFGSIAAGLAK